MIRCIYSPFSDIYFHLAAEEYLLKQGNEDIFMLWQDTPSVVIGKHQRLRSEVDQEWAEREQVHIARRFSGGGTVYHDLGNVNLTFIETTPRLPEFVTYLQRTLDFLNSMGLMATGGERLGIYLNGLKISGSAQCLYKDRVLYHCTLLYDTDLTALHQALNPEPMVDDEMAGTVTDFKEKAFQYFSKSQSVSAFTKEEIEAVNQLREEKYIQKEWIYSR